MVFRQSFKYSKNKKISFIKVIMKLEYLLHQNIYILFYIIVVVQPFRLKLKNILLIVKNSSIYYIPNFFYLLLKRNHKNTQIISYFSSA